MPISLLGMAVDVSAARGAGPLGVLVFFLPGECLRLNDAGQPLDTAFHTSGRICGVRRDQRNRPDQSDRLRVAPDVS